MWGDNVSGKKSRTHFKNSWMVVDGEMEKGGIYFHWRKLMFRKKKRLR
jgi:hypothetical protein